MENIYSWCVFKNGTVFPCVPLYQCCSRLFGFFCAVFTVMYKSVDTYCTFAPLGFYFSSPPPLITETCIFILECILEVQELSCLLKLIALERYTAFLHRRIENYTKRKLTNESWLLCKVQHWEKVCCVTIPCVHFPQLRHVLVCPFCSVIVRFTSRRLGRLHWNVK